MDEGEDVGMGMGRCIYGIMGGAWEGDGTARLSVAYDTYHNASPARTLCL